MLTRFLASLTLWLAAASPVCAAEHLVGDADGLASILRHVQPGDRIALRPGHYGKIDLRNRNFSPPIEVIAAEAESPPTFSSMFLADVRGVHFRHVAVQFGPTATPLSSNAVDIRRSADVLLDHVAVSSNRNGIAGDDASGVFIREGVKVSIVESEFGDLFRGVVIFDSDDISVWRNRFKSIGSDGVAARGSIGVSIAENFFSDFDVVDAERWHPDAIQIWSRHAKRANENVTIRANVIRRGQGDPTQGIFIRTEELHSKNLLIEENVVDQSMGQGIAVQGAAGVVIRNNSVVPHDARVDRPGIDVREPVSEVTVTGNITIASRIAPGVDAHTNAIAGYHHPNVEAFVRANIAGGVDRNAPGAYLPVGEIGARRFVRDLWDAGDDDALRTPTSSH